MSLNYVNNPNAFLGKMQQLGKPRLLYAFQFKKGFTRSFVDVLAFLCTKHNVFSSCTCRSHIQLITDKFKSHTHF